jgi:hypothetical protein
LSAKAAARTRSVVFYYAVPGISGKALLKSRFSVSCRFRGQIDAWVMVKHWCFAQWIARAGDFLGIHARAGAANRRFID